MLRAFESIQAYFSGNPKATIAVVVTAIVCLYYFCVWLFVGRDPSGGTIAVAYEPPRGLSPALMRYLIKKGFDEKGLTAAFLDMAAKGYLKIEQQGDSYLFSRGAAESSSLSDEEKALADVLLTRGVAFELKPENHERMYDAIRAMKKRLDLACEDIFLRAHRVYLLPGALLSGVMMLSLGLPVDSVLAAQGLFLMFFSLLWTMILLILLAYAVHAWRNARWLKNRGGRSSGQKSPVTHIAVGFSIAEIVVLCWLGFATTAWVPLVLLFHAALLVVAYVSLKTLTKAGRNLLDQIEGFRKFINAVEADRLNLLNPPRITPALFEKYLPYAFAFDAEERWASRFSDVVTVAAEGRAEAAAEGAANSSASLDLSSFGLFMQRWFPLDLGKITVEVGPTKDM
jgi:hypothetical protein